MNNIQKGRAGEMIALKYLIDNKANILETNCRLPNLKLNRYSIIQIKPLLVITSVQSPY